MECILSNDRPDQKWNNITIESMHGEAKLYIIKKTGEDVFQNYIIDLYDSWIRVRSNNRFFWYPIKELLSIREENNVMKESLLN